jgi:signal transduction histidine kinase
MSEEQVSRLFDEYSRFNLEANRTTEGTGLGMSVTRNLVRLTNGGSVGPGTGGKPAAIPYKRRGIHEKDAHYPRSHALRQRAGR